MQISDMASWDVQSFRLTGDASQRTLELATVGDVTSVNPNGVYVTQPDEQSIAKAREYIQKVMNNERMLCGYGVLLLYGHTVSRIQCVR